MIQAPLAFLAGLLTVAAPCVLPMLPWVVGASLGRTGRWRPIFIAAGFSLSFGVLALAFHAFSRVLGLSQQALRDAAIALLATFGLLMLWPRGFHRLSARFSGPLNRVAALGDRAGPGNLGGLLLGLSLGAVWTPCAGPVLGSILTLVATSDDSAQAAWLMAFYTLGAALPMLALAYGGQYLTTGARRLARHSERLQQAFGVLVVGAAGAMFLQWDSTAVLWLSGLYPSWAGGL